VENALTGWSLATSARVALRLNDLYRRFECLPLRQQVLTAENSRPKLPRNSRNTPIFRDYSSANRTAESGLPTENGVTVPAFLCKAPARSGFNQG